MYQLGVFPDRLKRIKSSRYTKMVQRVSALIIKSSVVKGFGTSSSSTIDRLYCRQFGFKPNHITVKAAHALLYRLLDEMEIKINVIFRSYMSKFFDTVSHSVLVSKLNLLFFSC